MTEKQLKEAIDKIEYALYIESAVKYKLCHIDPDSLQIALDVLKEKHERMIKNEAKRKRCSTT